MSEGKEWLPCVLTEGEKITFGKTLAEKIRELRVHQDESSSEKKRLADRERVINGMVDELSRIVDSGQEYREVLVMTRPDWDKKIITTTRLDTGQVIGERAMTLDERQVEIPDGVTRIGAMAV